MSTKLSDSILAKGVIGAFQAALKDLYKVAWVSNACDESESTTNEISEETKKAFRHIDRDSTKEECTTFVGNLKNMPDVNKDTVDKIGDSKIKDICNGVKKLQERLEQKLSSDSVAWAEMKSRCMRSQDVNASSQKKVLQNEEDLKADQAKRNEQVSKRVTDNQNTERLPFHAKDFRSLIPSYLKANAEEEIEFIERFSEAKLFHLRKRQEESEKKLVEASHKCNKELWEIVKETMKMKAFMEWVKTEYELKMKDYRIERDKLWAEFTKEMEECRELCKKYQEVDSAYVTILNEQREKELQKTKVKAAIIIQALVRGFLVRRRLKKSSNNPTVDPVPEEA